MKFLDQAKIYIKAGDGGNGACSFRHEKFLEFGGPDGGNVHLCQTRFRLTADFFYLPTFTDSLSASIAA